MHEVATTPKAPTDMTTPRRRLFVEDEENEVAAIINILISIATSIINVAEILRDYRLR